MKQQTTTLNLDNAAIHTSFTAAKKPRADQLTAVFLHGAGQSNSERFTGLITIFANSGFNVIALDFIGHGKTGGETSNNRLTLRTKHTLAAIAHWTNQNTPLILCGSSMSGHTALRAAAQLGDRVQSLWLLQPAIYAAQAEDVPFDATFTKILRTHESWKSSLALEDAAAFTGKALVTIGAADAVIPWGVIEELMANFRKATSQSRLEVFNGVGHELPTWLPQHPTICKDILKYLAS